MPLADVSPSTHCPAHAHDTHTHTQLPTACSLANAINQFEGGVVLVSHDMRLISQVAKDIYECDHKKVTRLSGDIMSYKDMLSKRLQDAAEKFEKDRRARASAGSGARTG